MNHSLIRKLHGPVAIYGASGFIGINLLRKLTSIREDVIGFVHNTESWRVKKNPDLKKYIVKCDLLNRVHVNKTIMKYKPQTIFNLSAYGSYSWDKDITKIYETNFNSTILLLENLKKVGFSVYIHAGSQSEYGLNATAPMESEELIPNSHYAVSKVAVRYLLKYYGSIEKLPVVHLRLYSVYGPWEEPERLIPTLIEHVKRGILPPFVAPTISRDFIYIDDTIEALITIAAKLKSSQYGEAFNIATGKKTTMKVLADLTVKLFNIKKKPVFGLMKNRSWDVTDWVGNPGKMEKTFGWSAKTSLDNGLLKTHAKYETISL